MVDLNWADLIIFIIVGISCVFGLKRGLIKEALSILNWVVALVVAVSFRDQLSFLLDDVISTPSIRQVVAFGCLFFATLLVGALVNYIIAVLVRVSGLSTLDKTLGFVFGLARGCVVVLAVLVLAPAVIAIDRDQWWADSFLIPNFLVFEDWARFSSYEVKSWLVQSFEQNNY